MFFEREKGFKYLFLFGFIFLLGNYLVNIKLKKSFYDLLFRTKKFDYCYNVHNKRIRETVNVCNGMRPMLFHINRD